MSRFFAFLWQLEELDAQWTILYVLGTWIFPKYCKCLEQVRQAETSEVGRTEGLSGLECSERDHRFDQT